MIEDEVGHKKNFLEKGVFGHRQSDWYGIFKTFRLDCFLRCKSLFCFKLYSFLFLFTLKILTVRVIKRLQERYNYNNYWLYECGKWWV